MERKLSQLFDLQRFAQNSRLAAVIAGVEERYAGALADDDLEMVSAAGDGELTAMLQDPWKSPEESEQPEEIGAVMVLSPEMLLGRNDTSGREEKEP